MAPSLPDGPNLIKNPLLQVLRDAQSKAQAVSPPQGTTAQPQEGGLGAVGNSTIKEFEVGTLPCRKLQCTSESCGGLLIWRWAVSLVGFLHQQSCTRAPQLEFGNVFSGLAAPCCNGRPTCSSGYAPHVLDSAVCFCSAQTSWAVPLCIARPAPAEPALMPAAPDLFAAMQD